MSGPNSIEHVHLSGIGGSAMAPLAGMLAERGYRVTGSDAGVYPPASTLLESLGIRWANGFSEANLEPHPDVVVIGNALSRGNPEVEYVLDHRLAYRSLPQVLEESSSPAAIRWLSQARTERPPPPRYSPGFFTSPGASQTS